jgi:hypothetical protein
MVFKLGIALATPFILVAVMMGASGVVVVDVKEGGPDGMHIVVPVPLFLAQAALTFAPDEAQYVECPEFAPYQAMAERIIEELGNQPDFVMVEVIEGDEKVLVQKVGNELQIDVEEGSSERVHCRVPLKSALEIIQSYDGRGFPTKAAIWGLKRAPMGTLVHVIDGDDEVKIRRF